jgi:hypothetical protein
VEFELTIPVFERAKTVHALHRPANVIRTIKTIERYIYFYKNGGGGQHMGSVKPKNEAHIKKTGNQWYKGTHIISFTFPWLYTFHDFTFTSGGPFKSVRSMFRCVLNILRRLAQPSAHHYRSCSESLLGLASYHGVTAYHPKRSFMLKVTTYPVGALVRL